MKRYQPITILKWIFTIGFFMVLPFGVGQLQGVPWENFPMQIWGAIAYVLIMVSCLSYLLNAFALKNVRASVVGIYITQIYHVDSSEFRRAESAAYLLLFYVTNIAFLLKMELLVYLIRSILRHSYFMDMFHQRLLGINVINNKQFKLYNYIFY